MPTQIKPRIEHLIVYVDVKTGMVYDSTGSSSEGSASADGLSRLERELFAVGANTVKFDGRIYRKVEDEAFLGSGSGKPQRTLIYELKR